MKTDAPQTKYLKDYRPYPFAVEKIDLTFRLFDDRTEVHNRSVFKPLQENITDIKLDGQDQKIISISIDGRKLTESEYEKDEENLTIKNVGSERFTLDIETIIHPHDNTALEGLYVSCDTFCTQCEAEGFRRITYYPDRPDVMSIFTTRIEADKEKYPVLLSNGNMTDSGNLKDNRHYAVWDDPFRKPAYLFALVAGQLEHIKDTFTTMTGKEVDLYIYCRKGDEEQCHFAMESLKNSMKWDEEKFGREYDLNIFNIVAISDFNMGAMENKSLNIFNTSAVLAHQNTATDVNFMRVEKVIGHEYFHNWTGDRITCRDWFQLSLKEGLTVYRDQEFSADMNSRAVQRIEDVTIVRQHQFPEDSGPMAHPIRPDNYVEIGNFYTVTVYDKGAEVIRMMEVILTKEGFRKGMDLYFERHDGQAVTCMDFVKCMEDANDADLSQFRLWYEQAGTPVITAKGEYDEANKRFQLHLSQEVPTTPGQPDKKPMHIPVKTGLIGPDGKDMFSDVLHLKEKEQTFTMENIASKPVTSLLRGFSAPVKLKTDQSDDDLRFLMVHDSDGFNRWQASQDLAMRQICKMLDEYEENGKLETDPSYIETFSELTRQAFEDGDKQLLSKSLLLPEIPIIAGEREVVDPSAIYAVRKKLVETIAETCHDNLVKIYNTFDNKGEYDTKPESIAARSLKNTALRYLAFDPNNPEFDLIKDQNANATNMTDRIAALSSMIDANVSGWEKAFEDFLEEFREYPLVVDKWFVLQSTSVREDTLERLKELVKHPLFTMKNPNRARSIYSAFAVMNPVCFHAPGGEGYQFLGQAIKDLNKTNPSIASRFLTPMREWKRYTKDRQDAMKSVLQDIYSLPELSKDVYEVVSKTLKD